MRPLPAGPPCAGGAAEGPRPCLGAAGGDEPCAAGPPPRHRRAVWLLDGLFPVQHSGDAVVVDSNSTRAAGTNRFKLSTAERASLPPPFSSLHSDILLKHSLLLSHLNGIIFFAYKNITIGDF